MPEFDGLPQQLIGFVVLTALSCGPLFGAQVLEVQTKPSQPTLNEPLYVDLIANNPTSDPIVLDLGVADANLAFDVVPRDGGHVTRLPSSGGSSYLHTSGEVRLKPNEKYHKEILLNSRFMFQEPGHYDLRVSFSGAASSGVQEISIKREFVLPLSIGARDEKRLTASAERLANAACQSRDLRAANDAARSLSYIGDAAAIPSLKKVLACALIPRALAVQGLARIGTKEAILPLVSAAQGHDDELAGLALEALRGLLEKRKPGLDKDLRTQIEKALKKKDPGDKSQ